MKKYLILIALLVASSIRAQSNAPPIPPQLPIHQPPAAQPASAFPPGVISQIWNELQPLVQPALANAKVDPATQQAIQALPPAWQIYGAFVLVLLPMIGRYLMGLASGTGHLGAIKSIFLGSSHAKTTIAVTPSSPPTTAGK
jgi:hypothetical protein